MSGAAPKGTSVENSQAKGPSSDDTPESHVYMAPKKQSSAGGESFRLNNGDAPKKVCLRFLFG